jgi:hypothetical protein
MDEYSGSNPLHAQPGDRFAGLPFRDIRRSIIQEQFSTIPTEQLNKLVTATRGLNKADLLRATEICLQTGTLPVPQHASNTCDPITGSWTERLLTIAEYKAMYYKAGFGLEVHNGFYNQWQKGAKAISLRVLNTVINLSSNAGSKLTPFIILVGGK